jgi:plastocyanin
MSRLAAILVAASMALHGACRAASIEVELLDQAGKPLPDAVVYAMPAAGPVEARPGKPVEIQQIDREFVPYVTVIQTGTVAAFPNRDPILHHVYSFSPAKSFEIKLYTGRSPSTVTFDKPGVVTLGCNIHDWMIGYVYVSESPYFAKTGSDGTALIADLPPRVYAVRVWHPQLDASEESTRKTIDATRPGPASVAWTLHLKREPKVRRAPAADGRGRY